MSTNWTRALIAIALFICATGASYLVSSRILTPAAVGLSTSTYGLDPINLVKNGNLEYDLNNNSQPDGWSAEGATSSKVLSWVVDPLGQKGKVLKLELKKTAGEPCGFGWSQYYIPAKQNTWYEFSFDYSTNNIEPWLKTINDPGLGNVQVLHDSTNNIGAGIAVTNASGTSLYRDFVALPGIKFSNWNEESLTYQTISPSARTAWQKATTYFKTPENAAYVTVGNSLCASGEIYFDDFKVRELNANPYVLKKSGTLKFMKFKGKDFFPIWAVGYPKRGLTLLTASDVEGVGFNTIGDNNLSATKYLNHPNLAVMSSLFESPLRVVGAAPTTHWVNNPAGRFVYNHASKLRDEISAWSKVMPGYANHLGFYAFDEIESHLGRYGQLPGSLNYLEAVKREVSTKMPGQLSFINFGGLFSASEANDYAQYFQHADVASFTNNMWPAYPNGKDKVLINLPGSSLRNFNGWPEDKRPVFIAFGLGALKWADWDRSAGMGGGGSLDRYLPFNLNRFQIFDGVINGATGAWFYGTYYIDLTNLYQSYLWSQITTISKELKSLYPILTESRFYDEWQVSDERVEAMLKKHDNKLYLITASTHYQDLSNVKFTLTGNYVIKSVKAINENVFGQIEVGQKRSVVFSGKAFTDNFKQQMVAGLTNDPIAPGYAVHIYEIETGPIASSLVVSAGTNRNLPSLGWTTLNGMAWGGTQPYTYLWSPAQSLSSANIANPIARPTQTTTYTLTVTDAALATSSKSVTITVRPLNTIATTTTNTPTQEPETPATITPAQLVVSAGTDRALNSLGWTTLNGMAWGGTQPYTYAWSLASSLSNPNVANPIARPTQTTTYTLTVTDASGQTASKSVTITVK